MARNKARDFATMTDDERARFAGEPVTGQGTPLDMEEPRDADRMGRHYPNLDAEVADPDNRDGTAAEADTAAHDRAVDRAAKRGR